MICLICMPSALEPAALWLWAYISGKSLVPMLELSNINFYHIWYGNILFLIISLVKNKHTTVQQKVMCVSSQENKRRTAHKCGTVKLLNSAFCISKTTKLISTKFIYFFFTYILLTYQNRRKLL